MAQPMRVLRHQQLSPEAEQLAATYQLGTPKAEYKVRFSKTTLTYLIVCLIGAVVLGGIAAAPYLDTSGNSTPDSTETIALLICALPFLAVAIYYALFPIIYGSWRVYVGSDGFVFKKDNNINAFRWDQTEAMWQRVTKHYSYGRYTGSTHKYTVRRKDGVQVVLNDKFADVEDLGNSIAGAITDHLLPQVISAYKAGSSVTFGSLSVSMQGLSNGKELLPWNQIKDIGINQGIVTVKKEGKLLSWSTVRVSKIPNFFVFMALVNYILQEQH